jgi:nucleotide-binding universal stress UspA family protein
MADTSPGVFPRALRHIYILLHSGTFQKSGNGGAAVPDPNRENVLTEEVASAQYAMCGTEFLLASFFPEPRMEPMIYPLRNIVAGLLEIESEGLVLTESIRMAERTGATLHLVHSYELPSLDWDAYGRMGYVDQATLDRYAAGLHARIREVVATRSAKVRAEVHAIAAPAAAAVTEVARETRADLVMVGATRHGAFARAILGTTAQRVVRRSLAPVLVLRQRINWPIHRVLLTTELTPFSAGVHELGLDVLETIGGDSEPELRSLMVMSPMTVLPAPIPIEQLDSIASEQIHQFLAQRRDRGRAVSARVRTGDAAGEIVAESAEWKPDYLVVGTHSRKATERWMIGSVAESTLRDARCNVLVVPAKAEEQRSLPVPSAASVPSVPIEAERGPSPPAH